MMIGVTKLSASTVVHIASRHKPSAASTVVSAAYIHAMEPLEFQYSTKNTSRLIKMPKLFPFKAKYPIRPCTIAIEKWPNASRGMRPKLLTVLMDMAAAIRFTMPTRQVDCRAFKYPPGISCKIWLLYIMITPCPIRPCRTIYTKFTHEALRYFSLKRALITPTLLESYPIFIVILWRHISAISSESACS